MEPQQKKPVEQNLTGAKRTREEAQMSPVKGSLKCSGCGKTSTQRGVTFTEKSLGLHQRKCKAWKALQRQTKVRKRTTCGSSESDSGASESDSTAERKPQEETTEARPTPETSSEQTLSCSFCSKETTKNGETFTEVSLANHMRHCPDNKSQ